MPKEKREKSKIFVVLIFSIVFFIAGGVAGYFIASHHAFPRGNFPNIGDATKSEITAFFDSNPSQDQVTSYCQQNMAYCFYYCRQVNPNYQYCSQLNFRSQRTSQSG
ncbi:MAG TPA: hypothetical protein VMC80_02580 [Patescibacteria group bacterium]|nr:hypothetical protein [Patescibacteria group bacterium]